MEECIIGTWVDGKPLYRKMIDFGTLPNNTRKEVKVSIENIKHCHINISNCIWMSNVSDFGSSGTTYSLVYPSYITSVYSVGGTNAAINIVTGQSNAANYKALLCIEYTKTTD